MCDRFVCNASIYLQLPQVFLTCRALEDQLVVDLPTGGKGGRFEGAKKPGTFSVTGFGPRISGTVHG